MSNMRLHLLLVPVVSISGKEIGKYVNDDDYRQKARNYYEKHLTGKSVENPLLGSIVFKNKGLRETISKNLTTIENLKYIAAVPKILKKSTCIKKEKPKHYKQDLLAVYKITGAVREYKKDVKVIDVIILEDTRHKKYYTFDAREKKSSRRTPP